MSEFVPEIRVDLSTRPQGSRAILVATLRFHRGSRTIVLASRGDGALWRLQEWEFKAGELSAGLLDESATVAGARLAEAVIQLEGLGLQLPF